MSNNYMKRIMFFGRHIVQGNRSKDFSGKQHVVLLAQLGLVIILC